MKDIYVLYAKHFTRSGIPENCFHSKSYFYGRVTFT